MLLIVCVESAGPLIRVREMTEPAFLWLAHASVALPLAIGDLTSRLGCLTSVGLGEPEGDHSADEPDGGPNNVGIGGFLHPIDASDHFGLFTT